MAVVDTIQSLNGHDAISLHMKDAATQSENSLLIAAQSLYALAQFRECSEVLKVVFRRNPQNAVAKSELTRTIQRMLEQQRGKYKFNVLYQEAKRLRPPVLDHATYIGLVEVRATDLRGNGLYTTKDVKAGDLLVCEKAFAYVFVGRRGMPTRASLIEAISERCSSTPSLIPDFTEMHHGDYTPKPVGKIDGRPVVDEHMIERTIDLNAFGGSVTTRSSHFSEPTAADGHSHGIWIMAAKINHACFYNCRRSFIGDFQIIRATQDIPANTELYFTYRTPLAKDHDFDGTQAELESYGFVCGCALCVDASKTSPATLLKREKIREELTAAFTTGGSRGSFDCAKVDTNRIETVLKKLERTYPSPASLVPRTGMWDPYLALTRMHAVLNHSEKVIQSALKTLENLGFVVSGATYPVGKGEGRILKVEKWGLVVDYLVEFWMMLVTAYAKLGDGERSRMAGELARKSYCIVVGEEETFEEGYGWKGRECIEKGVLWTGL